MEAKPAAELTSVRLRFRHLLLSSAAALLAVLAFALLARGGSSAGSTTLAAPRFRGTVQVIHLRRLGVQRDVWIYRPHVPDSSRLPVLYFLHGLPGKPSDIFHQGLVELVDEYIAHGGTPLVIAAPDGNSPRHSDTEWGDASDGSDNLEEFIVGDVFRAVEGNHPRDAAHRAIAGFSMGGYGAMNLAVRHPQLFGQVVSFAGYFHLDDPSRMFATLDSRQANDPDLNVGALRGRRVLLLDGVQDGLTLVNRQSQDFEARLSGAEIPSTLVMGEGGHSWQFVMSELPLALRFLADGWGAGTG